MPYQRFPNAYIFGIDTSPNMIRFLKKGNRNLLILGFSIFIEDHYRKLRLGDKLMKNALNWFESNTIVNISINVVYANDDVLYFYECYDFHVENYIFKKK